MAVQKAQLKQTKRLTKQQQKQRKQRRMRIIIWSTAVVFIAIIVLAIVFKPKEAGIAIDYDSVPTKGSAEAKVHLAEFGDFKCPTCKHFKDEVLPEIQKDYIDTGLVSLSFLNFNIIPGSIDASLAAQSIYHQNKDEFWKYYDALYANQQDESLDWATPDYLVDLAKQLDLKVDFDKLKADIDNKTYLDELNKQYNTAQKHNFPGTPTVLIDGHRLDDSQALYVDKLKAEIDKALAKAK